MLYFTSSFWPTAVPESWIQITDLDITALGRARAKGLSWLGALFVEHNLDLLPCGSRFPTFNGTFYATREVSNCCLGSVLPITVFQQPLHVLVFSQCLFVTCGLQRCAGTRIRFRTGVYGTLTS